MRGRRLLILATLVAVCSVCGTLAVTPAARALPEYSAQTGEPCATCHISASGGGLRTPRGQAWVGSKRPGTVPALDDALALLGVHLRMNQADFVAPASPAQPVGEPGAGAADQQQVRHWLATYEGN